jgi:hypothetical protein
MLLVISFIFFAILGEGAKDEKAIWKSARPTFHQQCYTFKYVAKKETLDKMDYLIYLLPNLF